MHPQPRSPRPLALPAGIGQGTWDAVVDLVAALDTPALQRTITMSTEQVQTAGTSTALDAGLCLLLASVEDRQRRADPSGDPESWRTVACYTVSTAITAGAAARLSGCAR